MKIYDCFTYFDEDLILDIRFHCMNKYVDKFIIIEAGETHQGARKEKRFNIKKFLKFKDKIIYKYIRKFPSNLNNWERENFQRNYIHSCINEANNDDLIIISDVDEIPNMSKFQIDDKYKYYVFDQKMFYYKLNILVKNCQAWHGSRACKKKFLISPQWLRSQKVHKKYPFWRIDKNNFKHIKKGGWHFSFLKTPENISKKIQSFAHSEFNINKITNIENIQNKIFKKEDLFNRGYKFLKIDLNNSFPEYILKNKIRLSKWII
jgi:beta-1,4-mannosyl-glycoprotein beta-1,4-N-acetylglucosaminyltransferase